MQDNLLLEKILNARNNEKKYTLEVLEYLQEISNKKIYSDLGYSSLFTFCTGYLNYSKSEAYIRVSSVKIIKKIPLAKKKIANNELSLSTATELASFMQDEKTAAKKLYMALDKICGKSKQETKTILNELRIKKKEQTLTVTISGRLLKKLQTLQKDYGDNSELQVIEALVDEKLREKEFQKKDKKERGSKNQRYITRVAKREVFRAAKNKCSKCQSGVHLELDHIRPIRQGGMSFPENLQLLCSSCNKRKYIRGG